MRVITHNGRFHADDVFCVAMLKLVYNNDIEVIRKEAVDTEDYNDDTYVVDIGLGYYDHHQEDCALRSDGCKHAACGILYKDLKTELFETAKYRDLFERRYICPVEDQDNGVALNPLSATIAAFCIGDDGFDDAVDFAIEVIRREQKQEAAYIKSISDCLAEYTPDNRDVCVLSQYYPSAKWLLANSSVRYIVYPSRGGFAMMPIGERALLPEEWLMQAPEGCQFVHQARFIAAFDSVEAAKAAAGELDEKPEFWHQRSLIPFARASKNFKQFSAYAASEPYIVVSDKPEREKKSVWLSAGRRKEW